MRSMTFLHRLVRALAFTAIPILAAPLAAQPASLPVQGFLADGSGTPIDATGLNITFRLYAAATGGTAFHEETSLVDVTDGRFVHYLGTDAALSLSSFTGAPVYIGVQVATGTELTPRIALGTTAYAAYAGRVPWTGVSGTPAGFADGVDNDTTYNAAAPLALNAGTGTFSLSSVGCDDGEGWIWDADTSTWQCEPASGGAQAAGAGLVLAGGEFAIDSPTCSAGQVSRWTGTGWVCATDATGLTSLTAGNGIGVAGSTISISAPTCSVGQYSRWTGTEWVCATDGGNTYTFGAGLSETGGNVTVSAATCGSGQYSRWTGTAWVCDTDATGLTSLTAGNGIAVAGSTISTAASTCASDEYSVWTGTSWTCRADVSVEATWR